LNSIIYHKEDKHYNYNQPTFKLIENGFNIRKKLDEMDVFAKENVFDPAYKEFTYIEDK
jgi:hypothetical protein